MFQASQNVDVVGKIWAAAQLLSSFLFKPTLAEGKCAFFHHFLFIKEGEKKNPPQKNQRRTDSTEKVDLGYNQILVSGNLLLAHPFLSPTATAQ